MSLSYAKSAIKSHSPRPSAFWNAIWAALRAAPATMVALQERMFGDKVCALALLAATAGVRCHLSLFDGEHDQLDLQGDDGLIVVETLDRLSDDIVALLKVAGYQESCPDFGDAAPIAYIFRSCTHDVHQRAVLWISGTPAGMRLAARFLAEGNLSAVECLPASYPGSPLEIVLSAPDVATISGSMGQNHLHTDIKCGDLSFQYGQGWRQTLSPPKVEIHYVAAEVKSIAVNGVSISKGAKFDILRILIRERGRGLTIDEILTEIEGVIAPKYLEGRRHCLRTRLAEIQKLDDRLIESHGREFRITSAVEIKVVKS